MDKILSLIKTLPNFKFKNNSYTKSRGTPMMFVMNCIKCKEYIMSYQKDGQGPLKRCYLDRIHHPHLLSNRQYDWEVNKQEILKCKSCNALIGIPYIYIKEIRPAYHLQPYSFELTKIS